MTAIITKWGNSKGIRIPKPYLENLGLGENDVVNISMNNDSIIIKKHDGRKTIEQRFEELYGTDFESALQENPYDFELLDWGKSEGDEIW
ncbi:MAG: AbrB/MazE/SpoVT family DNA-binding domain-containing protein [Defluviitaleaceae bacterium]|nr:AbrB/MazE/SpoVT family DNA-binding domain-containing protein [Defluviitaleaceae bacterium]